MNKFQKLLIFIVAAFSLTGLHAANDDTTHRKVKDTRNEANYQKYKNGFAFTSHAFSPLQFDYFLGKDNTWKLTFGVSPYTKTENLSGIAGQDSYLTSIGAGITYFLPIARNLTNNKLFIINGPGWAQTFGQLGFDAKIKSSWLLTWYTGLEYRFTPNFYLGMGIPAVSYQQTKLKTNNIPLFATDATQKRWNIFSSAAVYITFKM